MQIGGTLVTGVVRILVVVATLAAVYYFLVRPVLDTTEKVSGGITGNIQRGLEDANRALEQANVSSQTQQRLSTEIRDVPKNVLPRLSACINRDPLSVPHIRACMARHSQ